MNEETPQPFPCRFRSKRPRGTTRLANGVEKDVYACKHPDNRQPLAILARCTSCPPNGRDPIACSECPWIDPATGEDRPEPMPVIAPPVEGVPFINQIAPMMRVAPPPRESYKVVRASRQRDKETRGQGDRGGRDGEKGRGGEGEREASVSRPRRAVLSYALGVPTCEQQAITMANQRAYADRVGAEFICRTYPDRSLPYGPGIKWEAVAEHAHRFDQTLLLDPDVVVRACAPNIFDFVPLGCWGVCDERPFLRNHGPATQAQDAAARDLGIVEPWMPHVFNGGVLVMPPTAADVFRDEPVCVEHWSRDQAVLSARLMAGQADYRILDPRFNACWHYRDHDPSRAWFVHRAGQNQAEGHEARLRGLRMDVEREAGGRGEGERGRQGDTGTRGQRERGGDALHG